MALIEHVSEERWARELAKVTDPRRPPVPVTVWLSLDGRCWDGELHGWAVDPNGARRRVALIRGPRR